MKELDELFEVWEQRHQDAGYKRFIRDGIVDEEWWEHENTVPKICFLLKEARTEREEGYNLVQDLYQCEPWKLWQKVAVWTQAIQYAFTGGRPYNDNKIRLRAHTAIRQIAVVNVKKSNGEAESDSTDLWKYVHEDKDFLKKELELINPDIIVCGYTFGMLKEILGEELEINGTVDTMYGFWRDKLIIDYFHPACRYPNRVNYYALHAICQLSQEEWVERKYAYASKSDSNMRIE